MRSSFRIIALTPAGRNDAAVAISASRAGELGVLCLARTADAAAAREAIQRLARHGRGHCGVRLDAAHVDFVTLVGELSAPVRTVVLTGGAPERLREAVRLLKRRELTVLLEVTSVEEARAGEAAGVDGLIAKGHESGGRVGEETTFVLLQRLLLAARRCRSGRTAASACTPRRRASSAGAAGVVLDAQLALTRESPLPEAVSAAIARMDGNETVCLGGELGAAYRVYAGPARPRSRRFAPARAGSWARSAPRAEAQAEWRARRRGPGRLGRAGPGRVWPLGQDAAFAAALARRVPDGRRASSRGCARRIAEHVRSARGAPPAGRGGAAGRIARHALSRSCRAR